MKLSVTIRAYYHTLLYLGKETIPAPSMLFYISDCEVFFARVFVVKIKACRMALTTPLARRVAGAVNPEIRPTM